MRCQHAPVKEAFVAKVTFESRRHPRGVQRRPASTSPHPECFWTHGLDVCLEEVLEGVWGPGAAVGHLHLVIPDVVSILRAREHLRDPGLDLGDREVRHEDSLLLREVEYRDVKELGEEETEHQFVVGDDTIIADHDGVEEGVFVKVGGDSLVDCLDRVYPF